jgi:hypothetical protein
MFKGHVYSRLMEFRGSPAARAARSRREFLTRYATCLDRKRGARESGRIEPRESVIAADEKQT